MRPPCLFQDLSVVRFYLFLEEPAIDSGMSRRDSVLRGPLEHGQVPRLLGDHRDRLYAARARADDGHPLPSEVHLFMGPTPRVVPLSLEGVQPFYVRNIARRNTSDTSD